MQQPTRKHMPCTPDVYAAFWEASRQGREVYGLSAEAASDERVIENYLDLDDLEQRYGRQDMHTTLFDVFDKAHRILMHEPPMKPETQACFRELAFWNTVRILADFTVDDMAKSADQAARAKHADAIWPAGLMVKESGAEEFVQAKDLLKQRGYGIGG